MTLSIDNADGLVGPVEQDFQRPPAIGNFVRFQLVKAAKVLILGLGQIADLIEQFPSPERSLPGV